MKVTAILITKHKEYPIKLEGFDEVIIVTECPNIYTRYLTAMKAKNEIIYVQDDDCIVDYEELFKHYDGRLTNSMTEHHLNQYKDSGVSLVGWGCFFPKSMLSVFDKYIAKYGPDDFHLKREADRIFTYMNQPHNSIVMPHQDLEQTPDRMSFEPKHYQWAREATVKCRIIK